MLPTTSGNSPDAALRRNKAGSTSPPIIKKVPSDKFDKMNGNYGSDTGPQISGSSVRLVGLLVILVALASAGVSYFAGYQRGIESHEVAHAASKNWISAIEDVADRAAHSIHLPHMGESEKCYKPIPTLRNRGEIAKIVNDEGIHKVGVELGVLAGDFANHNLHVWTNCEAYYLVDLWAHQEHYADTANKDQDTQNEILNIVKEKLVDNPTFGHKVRVLRNSTIEASTLFEPNSVDFVYVDARHDYDGVMQDLHAWWPKIRPGGIMAGHDYLDAQEVDNWTFCRAEFGAVERWSKWCVPCDPERGICRDYRIQTDGSKRTDDKAVRSAVNEFAESVNRQLQVTYRDPYMSFFWESWVMRK